MKIKQVRNANVGQWENKTLFMIHYMGDFLGMHALRNGGCLWMPIKLLWLALVH